MVERLCVGLGHVQGPSLVSLADEPVSSNVTGLLGLLLPGLLLLLPGALRLEG